MIKSKLKISFCRNESQRGIWQFSAYLAPLPDRFKLSLGEGNTPIVPFAENLFLKREDLNPTGSLKDRGMAYLVSQAFSLGQKNLVLSSSGNAAISAARYCQLAEISLNVFVSRKINQGKLEELEKLGVRISTTDRPVSEAVKFTKEKGFVNLRPSQSKLGSEGYQTIAFELAEGENLPEEIFIPVSSGVALMGVNGGFKKLGFLPRFHLCQPASLCPLASIFDQDYQPEEKSLAEAIVARYTPLKNEIIKTVKESGGTGWVIENEAILEAEKELAEKKIETSTEGALTLAAWKKAQKSGWSLGKSVCLLTGKKY